MILQFRIFWRAQTKGMYVCGPGHPTTLDIQVPNMLPRGLSWDAKTLIRDNQRCFKRLSSIFFDVFQLMTNAPSVPIRGRQQRMNGSDYRGTSVGAPKLDCTDGKCLERTCQQRVGRKRKRVEKYERNQCIVT